MAPEARLDGLAAAGVPVASRGLAYGDGVFETVAVQEGRPRLLERHLQRLHAGCDRLGLDCDMATLRHEVATLLGGALHGTLKIIIWRDGRGRGYVCETALARRLLRWLPTQAPAAFAPRPAVAVHLCAQRLAQQPLLAGLKHLNRLEQVLARREWSDPSIGEGLLQDTSGHLIEAVSSNLFLLRDGRLVTPRLDLCGVAGVLRGLVIDELAARCGLPVEEARLGLDDLYNADELMLTNSLTGITPVARVGCFALPGQSLAVRLQGALMDWERSLA